MKLSHSGGQARLTIPKDLVDEMGWSDVRVVVLKKTSPKYMCVRRFESAKEEAASGQRNRVGGNR